MRTVVAIAALLVAGTLGAAQFKAVGDVEVHYVVVNTLYLEADVAARYGIVRGRDRAILNVSVVGPDGRPRDADVSGRVRNLLGHESALEFARFEEGDATYFIAPLKITDQDVLRFDVAIDDRRGNAGHIEFLERMWVQDE